MACFAPLPAWQGFAGGKISFKRVLGWKSLKLPCGQCVGCKLDRSRQWAVRGMHEASQHSGNSFITLTYDDKHVATSLDHRDWQLFAKRLRKRLGKFRFMMCGEYGSKFLRPHFHACLFGIDFIFPGTANRYFWRTSNSGFPVYRSPILEELWTFGSSEFGDVTFDSAAYVARYCLKKAVPGVGGVGAEPHSWTEKLDIFTGEIVSVRPEYFRMSLKPGIGAGWIDRYKSDVFPHDYVISNGVKVKPPKYYLSRLSDAELEAIKASRYAKSLEFKVDCTPERLAVRQQVTEARLNSKRRNLE